MLEPDLRETFGDYLVNFGKENINLVVLDCDLSSSTKTSKFAKTFPERFFNMGIAEQNMIGTALGFAISNKIPVVSGFSIFTTGRAWEFIRMACHDNLNLKIIATHGGIVGEDGSTHNALEDLSLMANLPNMTVLTPSDEIEFIQILDYSINNNGPFYIRLPRGSFPKIHNDSYKFILGRPDVLKEGNDICLIGNGYGTILAFKSSNNLERELGISLKIINLPSVKPINTNELINEIENVRGIVTIEEHNYYCGFGSILSRIISKKKPIPLISMGINDLFVESGNRELLLNDYGLNLKSIKKNILKIITRKM